jgi:integrase
MKSGKEHRVPLSDAAIALHDTLVFPGRYGTPFNDKALREALSAMRPGAGITVHGFRSCFRDWAAERTTFPNHVVEMALAHAIGNAVEKAYRRGDLFEKRRLLMAAWAAYLTKPLPASASVTPIRAAADA